MKKEFYSLIILSSLFLALFIISLSSVSADYYTNPCKLNITLINQDPYPAIPDSYVDLVFQVSGVQNSQCAGVTIELTPKYPFSTEGADMIRTLPSQTFSTDYNTAWMIQYKLKVDKDALDGDTPLEIKYYFPNWTPEQYVTQEFNINIKDSRTAFDAVIQQASGSDVSIAIANTGKYAANAVIVRIPEQDSFKATSTDGQMVGNLASGDYTLVSFAISPKGAQSSGAAGASGYRHFAQNATDQAPTNHTFSNQLEFQIYYTDNLGERRIVNMSLPLNLGNSSMGSGGAKGSYSGRGSASTTTSSSSTYWYIAIAIILIAGFIFYRKNPNKVKNFFSKSNHGKSDSGKVPDWVKNAREKERRK